MATPASKTWLVVGASRGIGYEWARQAAERGDRVFATVRTPGAEHTAEFWTKADVNAGRCTAVACDVLSEESIKQCVAELATTPGLHLDYAIINAGVLKYPNRATDMSYELFAFHLNTNTIGPIIFAQQLLKSNITVDNITFISSDSGSLNAFRDHEDGFAAYSASKAALNITVRHMDAELKRQGAKTTLLLLHPGEVDTGMGAEAAAEWGIESMAPEESVKQCIATVESKGHEDSGTFWQWDGKVRTAIDPTPERG